MKLSEHLKLNLPVGENSVHISVLTENFKKLDDSYKYTIDKVDAVEHLIENVDFSEIEEQIEQLENKLNSHTRDNNNPHRVTKHQIGLNKVDNTADIDKPVSKPTEERLKDFWGKEELEIGGRNHLLASQYIEKPAGTGYATIDVVRFTPGVYTLSFNYKITDYESEPKNILIVGDTSILTIPITTNEGVASTKLDLNDNNFSNVLKLYAGRVWAESVNNHGEFSEIKLEKGTIKTPWTPAPEDIQTQIDEVIQSVEDIPEVFHDLPQNEVKEEMTPAEFDYGVTLCSQSLITDFPSINEYGVSYTIIGKHSNYVQLFITRFGDIWSRRSSARSSWNGEWYNSKKSIDELSKELDTVKQSGVESNKILVDALNSKKVPASTDDTIKVNVNKVNDIVLKDYSKGDTVDRNLIRLSESVSSIEKSMFKIDGSPWSRILRVTDRYIYYEKRASNTTTIYKVDITDGTVVWKTDDIWRLTSIAINDSELYVLRGGQASSETKYIESYSLITGNKLWNKTISDTREVYDIWIMNNNYCVAHVYEKIIIYDTSGKIVKTVEYVNSSTAMSAGYSQIESKFYLFYSDSNNNNKDSRLTITDNLEVELRASTSYTDYTIAGRNGQVIDSHNGLKIISTEYNTSSRPGINIITLNKYSQDMKYGQYVELPAKSISSASRRLNNHDMSMYGFSYYISYEKRVGVMSLDGDVLSNVVIDTKDITSTYYKPKHKKVYYISEVTYGDYELKYIEVNPRVKLL